VKLWELSCHPDKKFIKVVLPDPEGPIIAVIVPSGIYKLIPFKMAFF